MKRRNYTLVEILTVVAVIAILTGISVGVVGVINNKNAEAKTLATIKALEIALSRFKQHNNSFYIISENNNPQIRTPVRFQISGGTAYTSLLSNNTAYNASLEKYIDSKLIQSSTVEDGNVRYFVDGWGRPLIYRVPGSFNRTGFDLGSAGSDGRIGDGGTELPQPTTALPTINDYNNFGQGDDITNFVRN